MERTILDKIKFYVLVFLIIALPFARFIHHTLNAINVVSEDKRAYVLWMIIPILSFTYLFKLVRKEDNFTYLDIIMISLAVLAGISTIFAIRVRVSIYGEINRYEGLLSLVAYYLIFLNAKSIKDEDDKRTLIKLFLCVGLFQVLYAILQVYTHLDFVKRFSKPYLATGFCGNPNFLASYMAMLVVFTGTYYIKNNKKKYLILAIIYNIGLVLGQSTGPFLAVIMVLIFIMIYFRKKEFIKRTLLLSLALLACFVVVNKTSVYVQEKVFKNKIADEYNIVREISYTSDVITKSNGVSLKRLGNGRLEIWMKLLPQVKKYWLVGAGLDNIAYIYPQSNHIIYDKAHNVYLQILLTNGLPALIFYCSLCLIIFIKGFKLKNDDIALYMAFVVYSIQAFVNISAIDVAPFFFLFFGLLASNFNEKLNLKELIHKARKS